MYVYVCVCMCMYVYVCVCLMYVEETTKTNKIAHIKALTTLEVYYFAEDSLSKTYILKSLRSVQISILEPKTYPRSSKI